MTKLYIIEGSDKGRSFDLKDGSIYIGRSPNNSIQMKDSAISRRHLKIRKRDNQFFVKDLRTKNGSYVNGMQIKSDTEIEVNEGEPIVIGMSIICIGKGCLENVMPFLDSIEISREVKKDDDAQTQDRRMTIQKNMELIYKVNDAIKESIDLHEISEKIIDCLFDLLTRIDRGAIILFDSESGEISEVISKTREPSKDTTIEFSRSIVEQVIQDEKAILISDINDEKDPGLSTTWKLSNIGSVMCVPMMSSLSRIIGVIYVDSIAKPYGFRRGDLALLTDLSSRAAMAIENSLLFASLERKTPT
jgi:Nif-specific regulatory protein